jgi:thiamine pyrophosphate-dependent acetolactate synthase large subunit-like protein
MTVAKPSAQVYVCLDVNLQEDKIDSHTVHYPETSRYLPSSPPGAPTEGVAKALNLPNDSKKPLLLFGLVNRTQKSWEQPISHKLVIKSVSQSLVNKAIRLTDLLIFTC